MNKSFIYGIRRAWNKTKRNITRPNEKLSDELIEKLSIVKRKIKKVEKKEEFSKSCRNAIYIGELLSDSVECINFNRILFTKGLNFDKHCFEIPVCYQKSQFNQIKREIYNTNDSIMLHDKGINDFIDSIHAIITIIKYEKKFGNDINALLELEIDKVKIGETSYDYIIRKNNVATIDEIIWDRDLYYLWECIKCFYVLRRQFKKIPPKYYLCWDPVYLEGVAIGLASKMGAQIINLSDNLFIQYEKREYMYDWDYEYHKIAVSVLNKKIDESVVEKFLEKLLDNKRHVSNIWLPECKDSESIHLLENGKKNIVIFVHCFYDAVRYRSGLLYRDYYEWLKETINIINKIGSVNWYIKDHPVSQVFKGTEEHMSMFKLAPHVRRLPKNISNKNLIDQIDGIVTCGGTAGAEYSCLGIPVITASNAWYTRLGFTIDSNSIDDYKRNLEMARDLKALSEKQVDIAKKTLNSYLLTRQYNESDELHTITMKHVRKAFTNNGYDNIEFLNDIIELDNLKNTETFIKGLNWNK